MKFRGSLILCFCIFTMLNVVSGGPGSSGGGKSAGGKSSSIKAAFNSKTNSRQIVGANAEESKTGNVSKGSILSAWGIISLMVFIIVGSATIYYVSIFYPLICAKRGKYDVMEMSAV